MSVKVGDKFRTRDGSIASVVSITGNDQSFVVDCEGCCWHYTMDPSNDGWMVFSKPHRHDLIEKIPGKKPQKVKVWLKNNDQFPWGHWRTDEVYPSEKPQEQEGTGGGSGNDGDEAGDNEGNGDGEQGDQGNDWGGIGFSKIEEVDGKKTMIDQFGSVDELVTTASSPRTRWNSHSRRKGNKEWSGTNTFEEAVSLARNGWPEGLLKVNEAIDFFNRHNAWYVERSLDLDVGGAYPLVPEFVGGNPAYMVVPEDQASKRKPIMKIMVNGDANAGITARQLYNFGAALMVCVDQIESLGTRVDLELVQYSHSGDDAYFMQTKLKNPQDHMEKNRLIFALGNAAMLRRFNFSMIEMHPELEKHFQYGYGRATNVPEKMIPSDVAYIPVLESFGESETWEKIDASVAFLQNHLGIKVDNGQITRKEAA